MIVFASLFTAKMTAQVNTNLPVQNNVANSNAFFDASTNFDTSSSSSNSIGKGLVFPDTNLNQFRFDMALADGITFPSYFNGMLVYNTATGTTADPLLTTQTTDLVPGWYYFSNPNGLANGSVTAGRWLPVGGNPKFNVVNNTLAGTATNTQIDNAQVYAYKGQFTTNGSSTAVTLAVPTGISSVYGITIFKRAGGTGNKVVFSKELYSYNAGTGAAITGSPSMSVVYPADTYDYIIEYFK